MSGIEIMRCCYDYLTNPTVGNSSNFVGTVVSILQLNDFLFNWNWYHRNQIYLQGD